LPPDLEIFTVEEAAVFLRVAPQTIRNELAAGRMPGRKIGKGYRLSREALIRWLDQPAERRAANKRSRRTARASTTTGGTAKG
jgi:excisionase family DNA binding protein